VASHPELEVQRPQIYYGELTRDPVVVNSEEPEFDYPTGETNAYIRYPGRGGVRMDSLWRKFIYGWKFDGTRFLLSRYPQRGTRVMFHRQVQERVKTIAPFLELDEDPYIVLVASVSLPHDRFWDFPVAKIDSPTRQPLCPGRPASAARSHCPLVRGIPRLPHWLDGARMRFAARPLARKRTPALLNRLAPTDEMVSSPLLNRRRDAP